MLDNDSEIHPLFENAPNTTEFKKLRKRLIRQTREVIETYGMIKPGANNQMTSAYMVSDQLQAMVRTHSHTELLFQCAFRFRHVIV